jgi:phospholipid/cholesterol/gamma-HCH transport system ATP-binding protein
MIRITGVRKSFGGKPVLRGVDLEIRDGETLTIIGGSGQGKSVLLKSMIGLIRPDGGTILVDGADILHLPRRELHRIQRQFGYLFQGGALFDSMNVAENVAFGLRHSGLSRDEIQARVRTYLEYVGLSGVEHLMPDELSGGMRKRVALARTIAYSPRYILYDEPTTGLDPQTSDVIAELIVSLQKRLGVTSVVVTHDIKAAVTVSQRVAMLHNGVIAAVEPAEALIQSRNPVVRQFIDSSEFCWRMNGAVRT